MAIQETMEEYELLFIKERELFNYCFFNKNGKERSKDYCLKLYFSKNDFLNDYLKQELELLKKYSARIKELKKLYKKHKTAMFDINDCEKVINDLNDFYDLFLKKYNQ